MSSRTVIIIVTAVLASLLEIVDASIVNVAIPTMMGNLGVTLDDISWVSTAYMIANSIVLPIAAWIGSRLGRRTYFTTAILLFTAASFACAMAPNLPVLVFFRILQGLAGGALLPTSQALIQEQFPPEKAGIASAIFGMSVMIGPALGPTLGGFLTDTFGWRSIFNINVPLGLFAAFMSWTNIENVSPSPAAAGAVKKGIDWMGLGLLCMGVGCFQFILERGETEGWWDSALIRFMTVPAAVGIVTFIWWELKIDNPIMNLRLFKKNVVRSGMVLMMVLGVMVYSLTFVIPVFISRVVHLTATQTGVLFIPGSILTAAIMMPAGYASRLINPRYLIVAGMGFAELALLVLSHSTTATGASDMYLPLVLRGAAVALMFIPINSVVLGSFRGEELGQVAGMMNFFRQMGGSIGIASLSTVLTRFSAQNYADIMGRVTTLAPVSFQEMMRSQGLAMGKLTSTIGLGGPMDLATKSLYGRVQQQVFLMSFDQLCWVIMIIFALGLIPLFTIKAEKGAAVMDAH